MRKVYLDAESLSFTVVPTGDMEFVFIQTEGDCTARITLKPEADAKFKVKIYIYAEGNSAVDCVCTLDVGKFVSGVETDIQIRSWPFDKSKIKARPEMFIRNSNVVATHGNALGTLSDADRYYLASRGIVDYKELIKQSLINER
jgi:Fe-S cluster assembly scaffold protein SufB